MLRPHYYELYPPNQAMRVVRFVAWAIPEFERAYNSRKKSSYSSSAFREFHYDYKYEAHNAMAKRNDAKTDVKASNAWVKPQWANIPLQGDDEAIVIERANNRDDMLGGLLELFDGGFSVSIKRRDDNQTVQVTITGTSIADPSGTIGVSAYAPDLWVAISALLYKYHDIAGGDIESFTGSKSSAIG